MQQNRKLASTPARGLGADARDIDQRSGAAQRSERASPNSFAGNFRSRSPLRLPATAWLMLSGLAGLGAIARRGGAQIPLMQLRPFARSGEAAQAHRARAQSEETQSTWAGKA